MRADTPPPGEAIELITPNADVFGNAETDLTTDDIDDHPGHGSAEEHRAGWATIAAALVLLALVAAGVLAAAPWAGEGSATATTTGSPPSTSIDASIDRPRDLVAAGPPNLVLDRPGELRLAAAWGTDPSAGAVELVDRDWFGLWATPGATRTSGRWLAITTLRSRGVYYETRPDAVRIEIGRDFGVLTTDDDGVTRVIFTAHDDTPIEIGGFGVSMDELRAIADELETAQRSIFLFYGRATAGVIRDMDPLVQTPVPTGGLDVFGLLSQPLSGVVYADRSTGARLGVQLDDPSSDDDVLWAFLVPTIGGITTDDAAALTAVAGGDAVFPVGTDPDVPGSLLLRWHMNGQVVTASSAGMPLPAVLDALGSARLPGQTEWAGLVQGGIDGEIADASDDPAPVMTRTVIGRSLPGSIDPPWRIEMSPTPLSVFASAGASGWSGPIGEVPRTPTLHRFASSTMTYLVATAPATGPARTLRVTVAGRGSSEIPLSPIGTSGLLAGGYAYAALADASIEFLDDEGNVVG
ncbi:MAG: hypothetical protein AB7R77_26460 [Ilumatobacteraceae bacterium]